MVELQLLFPTAEDIGSINNNKRDVNTIGWNYFGPSVKDCDLKVRVVGECLCCAETNDIYAWGLQQLQ